MKFKRFIVEAKFGQYFTTELDQHRSELRSQQFDRLIDHVKLLKGVTELRRKKQASEVICDFKYYGAPTMLYLDITGISDVILNMENKAGYTDRQTIKSLKVAEQCLKSSLKRLPNIDPDGDKTADLQSDDLKARLKRHKAAKPKKSSGSAWEQQ